MNTSAIFVTINNIKMKTHKVLDLIYRPDEGQDCFQGTPQECQEFIAQQGGMSSMYKTIPMTPAEILICNQ